MRVEWTPDGFQRVVDLGLNPVDVHAALTGPGPHLLQPVDGDMLSVLVRTAAGTLIEVWLTEDDGDGAREIFAAFDAGLIGQIKWRNAFGRQEDS